jgi:hypothetical protein
MYVMMILIDLAPVVYPKRKEKSSQASKKARLYINYKRQREET